MGKSLPPVSAKVIADIEQYVSELNRAVNVTRRTSNEIEREVGDLAKKVKSKFSLGDVGKDILKGAGLFGGFQVAQTAADAIVGYFREAADWAQKIEASTQKWLDNATKIRRLSMSDEQILGEMRKERERLQRQLDEASRAKTITTTRYPVAGAAAARPTPVTTTETLPLDLEKIRTTTDAISDLDVQIAQLQKTLRDKGVAETQRETADRGRVLGEQLRIQESAFDQLVATQKKANDETARTREEATKLAEKYREMADPALRYKKEIDEINALMADGKLRAEDAARAIDEVKRAMTRDEGRRITEALDQFFGGMDSYARMLRDDTRELANTARDVGFAFASAFEEAVIGGEKLSDVVSGLINDLARMALRLTVTNPLMNSVFGASGLNVPGWSPLPGFAGGGDFTVGGSGGTDSKIVAFRATPGERVSVRTPGQSAAGGGTYYIDARGADRAGLARLEAAIVALHGSIEERSVAAVLDAQRRRIIT